LLLPANIGWGHPVFGRHSLTMRMLRFVQDCPWLEGSEHHV
jgi:hypothetical protein